MLLTIYDCYSFSLHSPFTQTDNSMKTDILKEHSRRFGKPQIYIKSPGRANIIGEHTDYNQGLALPFTIDKHIHMAVGTNELGRLRVFARDIDDYQELPIHTLSFQNDGWIRYFINALVALPLSKTVGLDVVFGGDIPQGGGVSSSSALTCGFVAGVNTLLDLNHTLDQLIDLASQAENGIGLNGGIMDQTTIFQSKEGYAILINFLTRTHEFIQLPPQPYTFYLFNSGQKHDLVATAYNDRRSTCELALKMMKANRPEILSFRDVRKSDIEALTDPIAKKRSMYVLKENTRVEAIVLALRQQKYLEIGKILIDAQQSLSQNYEVSTPEIDYLVNRSLQIPNILGGRLMGGGFGGCTINLADGLLSAQAMDDLKEDYYKKTKLNLTIEKIQSDNGIRLEKLI